MKTSAANLQLRVDMLACDAYGYCAELLPEIVALDEWGYPIVTGEVTPELLADARRASAACPMLALRLAARDRRTCGRRVSAGERRHRTSPNGR
jgi:ferredoxin